MSAALAVLLVAQFLVVVTHDLIDIPGWTHGSQVASVIGRRKLYVVTAINAVFPGAAAATGLIYLGRSAPRLVTDYWFVYCAVTVASAVAMWYLPYFLGASESTKREYAQLYEGTRQVLPARGDNPRPNLLHLCFHVLFVITLVLSALVWFRSR